MSSTAIRRCEDKDAGMTDIFFSTSSVTPDVHSSRIAYCQAHSPQADQCSISSARK